VGAALVVLEVIFGKSADDSKNLDERQNHIGGGSEERVSVRKTRNKNR
jgi:hypothetical protein